MTQSISIDLITIDARLQSRAKIDSAIVVDYAEQYREGAPMPPVTLFFDQQDYWLADGFQRVEAAKMAGLSEIAADVQQGEFRDALLFSAGANATHGLRRTNDDKRRAVEILLADPEWAGWSDREIGRRCGVTHDFVGTVRSLATSPVTTGAPKMKIYRNKHGGISIMNPTNIGKGRRKAASGPAPGEIPDLRDPPKPCPFCAKTETRLGFDDGTKTHRVFCVSCTAIGPGGDTEERAIFDWNYRQ